MKSAKVTVHEESESKTGIFQKQSTSEARRFLAPLPN
jgi:hypothetical protein